jgi:type IV pilus assembly protein PilA
MLRNTRKGFTLIELLIVVVIIGILAAIAIPKFASTKEKAYLATMKSDLRNLATAEEGYFADNKVYFAGDAVNPGTGTPTGTLYTATKYAPSTGVTVNAALNATGGWLATANMDPSVTPKKCYIFVGLPEGMGNVDAKSDGEPTCSKS